MAPNLYARLSVLRRAVQGNGAGTSNDEELLALGERVARAIDEMCRRHFYTEVVTRVYDGNGKTSLWLPDDYVSITSFKVDVDGDGVFEKTLTESTDFWLWPDNANPKQRVDLNPNSANGPTLPSGRRTIQVAGVAGYDDATVALGTLAAELADDATSFTFEAAEAGDTLVIGSEQLYVSAEAAGGVLTVERGVNGTTAATHALGAAVSVRVFPRDVEQAYLMQVTRYLREMRTGFSGQVGSPEFGGFAMSTVYPAVRDLLDSYVMPVVP